LKLNPILSSNPHYWPSCWCCWKYSNTAYTCFPKSSSIYGSSSVR